MNDWNTLVIDGVTWPGVADLKRRADTVTITVRIQTNAQWKQLQELADNLDGAVGPISMEHVKARFRAVRALTDLRVGAPEETETLGELQITITGQAVMKRGVYERQVGIANAAIADGVAAGEVFETKPPSKALAWMLELQARMAGPARAVAKSLRAVERALAKVNRKGGKR